MEAAPYDNVEFGPITRGGNGKPATGTWPGPMQAPIAQPSSLLTQQQTSRTLQPSKGVGGGIGAVGAANRLAPLQESNAEIAESRDQRMQAVAQQSQSSFLSSSSSSSSQQNQQRTGFSALSGTTGGTSAATGASGTTGGQRSQLLTMSAATTTTPTGTNTTTTTAGNSAFKTTSTIGAHNKAADTKAISRDTSAPTYMLTQPKLPVQVGSGGTKDAGIGLRSADDEVDFKRHDLDPRSRSVLEKAYTVHGEFYRLNSKVLDEGALLKQDVLDIYRKSGETFSYEQLLQGMLEDGEMLLLGGCWLHYMHIEFKDETGEKIMRQPYGRGRLCLTSHRVLLLSADVYTDANLEPYGDVQKGGGYKLEVSKQSSVVFRNLPLSCFHSAEVEVHIGTSAQTKITPKPAMCCGLCSCFGIACCNRRWHSTPPMTRSFNERVIQMGVALPPWGTHSTLVLHLDPGQSLTTARDFVAQLHQHSPNMH